MEENLNIINQWGKPQKREGASNQRKVNTIFGSNLVEGNIGGKLKKPFLCANANMNKDSSKKKIKQ